MPVQSEKDDFLQVLWADLPLLNYGLYALGIAHAEITNLPNQRLDLVITAIFPMFVPWVIYGLRFRSATFYQRVVAVGVSVGIPSLIGLNLFFAPRYVIDHHQLRNIYEAVAILNTVFLMAHGLRYGRNRVLFFLGPAALYGLLLENGGILLGYFQEMNYLLYLGPLPAPVATMSGWITVYYIVSWTTWEMQGLVPALRRTAMGSAIVATLAALCFDLQVDPLATEVGFWRWHPMLERGWMGVPVLNFAAWSCAVFPFTYLLFSREAGENLAPGQIDSPENRRWILARVPLALFMAAVLFLATMALIEHGITGPSFTILRDTAFNLGILSH